MKTGKEIYEELLEYADGEGNHELNNVKFVDIQEIILLAENFENCPHCGHYSLSENHYCNKCLNRIITPDDAYFFAQFLKEHYELTRS